MSESTNPGPSSARRSSARPSRGLALVTGASAGIGRELAWEFASHGFDLAVVARSADALEELADEILREHRRAVHVLPRDLLAPGVPLELFDALEKEGLAVDVLVNNAGVMELGSFTDTPIEVLERLVELNTRALTSMTRAFLPPMRQRGRGRILNVASVAGFQPVPAMAAYGATKAFVLSLSEALSEELSGTGVTVTALCPGVTDTDMMEKARAASERVAWVPEFMTSNAREVARAGYEACMAGRVIEVPGLGNRVLTDWSRFQPRWIVRSIGGLIGRRFL